jgi:hypothetical protein
LRKSWPTLISQSLVCIGVGEIGRKKMVNNLVRNCQKRRQTLKRHQEFGPCPNSLLALGNILKALLLGKPMLWDFDPVMI